MDSLIPIAVVALLLLVNALFVAAEFAIVGTPRAAIDRRAAEGNRIARQVSRILRDPRQLDRYIATAQVGITLASLGLGMYGEHALAEWLAHWLESWGAARWIAAHSVASILAVAALTYFHIVLGEMVPKALALQRAEQTALLVTPLMAWVRIVFFPLVMGLNGIGNLVLRVMGIDRQAGSEDQYHTAEELQMIVEESQERGLLGEEAGEVLQELFEFGELTAGEVMTPRVRVTGLTLDVGLEQWAAAVRESPHTRYPVYDGDLDHIVGMIHIKDLLRCLLAGRAPDPGDIRPVPYVPEAAPLDEVLATMQRKRTHLAIVMDEFGGTAGLLTMEDLFEEVVGDIDEESSPPELQRGGDGLLRAAGTARLEEVGERLDTELEHDEVDTVSGLILTLLGRPPQIGDAVDYAGVGFEVTAVEGNGVREAVITLIAEEGEET